MTEAKKTPLEMLRAFFEEARLAKLARSPNLTMPRKPTAKTAERRAATAKAWKLAQATRHARVAGCNKCHGWFASFFERYAHDCPGKVG